MWEKELIIGVQWELENPNPVLVETSVSLISQQNFWPCMCGSRNISEGGGPGQSDKKKLWQGFFFFCLVLSLFYRSQMVNFKEIYHFSRFQRGPTFSRGGSDFFQGGSDFFQGGGSNCLFLIETHITCDFPGGGGPDPLSHPLDPHLTLC